MLQLRSGLALVSVICLAVIVGCGGGSSTGPDFTLSSSWPMGGIIAQAGQGTSTITITPLNGFNGSVTLSVSGVPDGVTTAFLPSSTATSSTLTFTASATATMGTATMTITGVSGTLTSNTTVSLTVIKAGQINHVVIIFQENRTVDNLFHDPVLMNRGADIATQGQVSSGQTVTLTPTSDGLVTTYDLDHSHHAFLSACNYNSATGTCAMNGADRISCGPPPCPTYPQYQYVDNSSGQIQPYFTMAETYTFSDRMFQTNEGPSFPAHQYILSGTSRIEATSTTTVADNPEDPSDPDAPVGCLAPATMEVNALDLSQAFPQTPFLISQLCFEHPTLTDLLNGANLSWKYYAPTAGSIWTAPDAIQHMCVPSPPYPADASVCTGSDWTNNVVLEGSNPQIITDITNGQLAAVSWVVPNGQSSDHAASNNGSGPSWVANIVNAIGQSPQYWADTTIIITWDDWGGWYDHVPPQQIRDSYEYGLRVPLIVISPYAKPAYISHQPNDFGSILKFIEEVFSLPDIDYTNPSVPYADSYALGDLSDCFNFSQTPLVFTPIPVPLDADYFLNDKSPPLPPDND